MRSSKRAALVAVCVLCAAGTVSVIAHYGAPLVRTALAGVIGLLIVSGMVAALRATRRGDLMRDHRHADPASEPGSARVYYLPQAYTATHGDADEDVAAESDQPRRVVRHDSGGQK